MNLEAPPNINICWASLLVEELTRLGITYFGVAPGSRSSPLVIAVAENKKTRSTVHYDERGLAFHALGYMAATGKPAAIISTSGTATANFLPAVIEASKKKLPLIILTADRPPELRATGANQTVEQVGIYSHYTRYAFDVPCPDTAVPPEFILTTAAQAVYQAQGAYPGPVHLNCMFREPLTATPAKPLLTNYLKPLSAWFKSSTALTTYHKPQKQFPHESLNTTITALKKVKKGIIAVGKLNGEEDRQAVLKLARKLNWPVFADVSSGLRTGNADPQVIHYFDQLLAIDPVVKNLKVDGLIQLGGRMTSQKFYDFIKNQDLKHYFMVLNHPLRNDPQHQVTHRYELKIRDFCNAVLRRLTQRADKNLVQRLQHASRLIGKQTEHFIAQDHAISEIHIVRVISQRIPEGHALYLGNSLPIREMDSFADPSGKPVNVTANRGASGIDGTIASACGFARGSGKPLTLVLGDLACLHDLNSLSLLTDDLPPVTLVVLNNNGGGIFSFLPVANYKNGFEKFFGTPHNLSFNHAAEMFKIKYYQPTSPAEFNHHYGQRVKGKSHTFIEVKTSRNKNVDDQQTLKKQILVQLKKS